MLRCLSLPVLLFTSLRADVTVRYETKVASSPIMPPEARDQLKKTGGAPITMLVKGSKGYTLAGNFASITDLAKQTTIVMNTEAKTYASVAMNEYQAAVAQIVPKPSAEVQNMLENLEAKLETRSTGRTETIRGIRAEERLVVMTMTSKAATDQEKPGQLMRMVMEIWSAAPGEASRVPALGEIERFSGLSQTAADPAAMIEQILGPYSGMAKGYDAMAKELLNHRALVLKTHVSVYVPSMVQTAAALAKSGKPVPGFDPEAPLSEITQEVIELSTAPVEDSAFDIPASFQPSTVGEILKSRLPQLAR